jgi:RES domain-containing protein
VTLTTWRIVESKYKNKAFSGDGARLFGGRWNSKGLAVIYTAGSLALASIEMVINLPSPKLLEAFVRIPVNFDADLVEILLPKNIPGTGDTVPSHPRPRPSVTVGSSNNAPLC